MRELRRSSFSRSRLRHVAVLGRRLAVTMVAVVVGSGVISIAGASTATYWSDAITVPGLTSLVSSAVFKGAISCPSVGDCVGRRRVPRCVRCTAGLRRE